MLVACLHPLNDLGGTFPCITTRLAGSSCCCPSCWPGPWTSRLGGYTWFGWMSWSWPPLGMLSPKTSSIVTFCSCSWGTGRSPPTLQCCGGLGVVSCHQNVWVARPVTLGDTCNALKSINSIGLWGQVVEVQGFQVPVLLVRKITSGSSGLLVRSHTW